MKDQHRLIKGYRDLSQVEIDLMNEGKALAVQVGEWIDKLQDFPNISDFNEDDYVELDQNWVHIGKAHLQQGFMAAIRAIAKPTTF